MHAVCYMLRSWTWSDEIVDAGLIEVIEGEGDFESMRGFQIPAERARLPIELIEPVTLRVGSCFQQTNGRNTKHKVGGDSGH